MIDSHCHLDSHQFGSTQADLVREAREAGVSTIVNIGADLPSSRASVELASRFAEVYATVGIHPHDAKACSSTAIAEIRSLAGKPKVQAIGEIGLDYYRDLSPRPQQKKAFEEQLEIARELSLPVVIHCRDAWDDTIDIIRPYASRLPGVVFHCFPGTVEQAHQIFELGFIIAVGGQTTYKNSLMATVTAAVPLDKIMLETDAPYLTPVPYRGQLNRPAYMPLIAQRVAELRSIPVTEVERVTDHTAQKFYRLVETFGD